MSLILDIPRFAHYIGRDPEDDAVWFAVETAEMLVTVEAGPRLTDPPQPAVQAVAMAVAARMLAGPPGVASEGEGGTSFAYKADAGTLALTADERALLHKAVGRHGGLGEIATRSDGYGRRRFDPGPDRGRHWPTA